MAKKGASGILHMRGGTGPGSYNEFSKLLESNSNEFFWPKLSHAIANACNNLLLIAEDDDDAGASACFTMADFGCSCAWNTVNSMRFMAKCVSDHQASTLTTLSLPAQRHRQLHIQAFFNDLPSNDFNTLFSHLASCQPATQTGFHFMPCGLPGSFYSRLFPSRSLHIGLCTLALHNLSQAGRSIALMHIHKEFWAHPHYDPQIADYDDVISYYEGVPDVVQDQNSPAWNENGTWILDGCKIETAMAYKEQFTKDFTCFLQHRSEELVVGGLLFCVMFAAKGDHTSGLQRVNHDGLYKNLQTAWRQLVSEGLLKQGSLDTFNIPMFVPTVDEVKEVVCGDVLRGEWEVVEAECGEVERAPMGVWMERAAADGQTWGRTCETMVRNFAGSLIQPQLNNPAKFEMLMDRLRHVASTDDDEVVYRKANTMHLLVLALLRR